MTYTIKSAEEWSVGQSINGTGRRVKIKGYFVVNPQGRNCRAFTGKDAEQKAKDWAKHLNERMI